MTLFVAPTINFLEKSLNGAINDAVTTITLNNATNLQAPGYAVINRVDSSGTATPNSREVISYTGISGSNLTGVTRAADSSTARSHSDASKVEFTPTVGMFNSLATILATAVTSDGYLKAINSPVSLGIGRFTQFDASSIASIAQIHATSLFNTNATITGSLNVSGASVTGIPIVPVFSFVGNLSGPTTLIQTPLIAPKAFTLEWVNVVTRTVASGASAIVDINKNGTSIFDTGTRPAIVGGGTLISTASIATKTFNQGDRISWDYDTTGGHITDFNILLRGT